MTPTRPPSARRRPAGRRLPALLGAAAVAALGIGVVAIASPARPAGAATAAGSPAAVTTGALSTSARSVAPMSAAEAATAPPDVSLLGQSTWAGSGEDFSLRLGLPRDLPTSYEIDVTVYPRLVSRSYFDQAAAGMVPEGGSVWQGAETVAAAPAAAGGGVWARIPVETALGPGDLSTAGPFYAGDESGVYPLTVQVIDVQAGYLPVGGSLSTFLVYSAGTAQPRLATSVTVPVSTTPELDGAEEPSGLSAAQSSSVEGVASVLAAEPTVPVSLAVSPRTAQALQAGSSAQRTALNRLATLVGGGDELLPEPYVPVTLAALDAAGLDAPGSGDQLTAQLAKGDAVLRATLGATPDATTWEISDPVDAATIGQLRSAGLRNLILPDDELSSLPAADTTTTYARPTALDVGGGSEVQAVSTDPVLQARITQHTGPVLAAEQTLAELAMIETETPSVARGVAITLPADGSGSGVYLSTLLAGLRANPFARAVTASELFRAVPVGAGAPVRTIQGPSVAPVPDAATFRRLQTEIAGLSGFLPADTGLVAQLSEQLLVAPATGLSDSTRTALLATIAAGIHRAEATVRLPPNTSVTLTSLKATLPLTVASDADVQPHVRLVLQSPKLGFRPWRPPGGTCTVTGRTSEVCDLILHGPQTILKVPVEARTSGVFFLDVSVTSPDGSLTLASGRDTVRSTAVSFVGIVIIVVAVLLLAIWWVRDIRSGRRPTRLVRGPGDDVDDDEDGGPPDGGAGPAPPSEPPGPGEPAGEPARLVGDGPVVLPDEPAPVHTGGRHRVPAGAPSRRDRHLGHGHLSHGHLSHGDLARSHVAPSHVARSLTEAGYLGPGHLGPGHLGPGHLGPGHLGPGQVDSRRKDAPEGRGRMSPSPGPSGPNRRHVTPPPEEPAP